MYKAREQGLANPCPLRCICEGDTQFSGVLLCTGSGNHRDPILVKVGSTTPKNTVAG